MTTSLDWMSEWFFCFSLTLFFFFYVEGRDPPFIRFTSTFLIYRESLTHTKNEAFKTKTKTKTRSRFSLLSVPPQLPSPNPWFDPSTSQIEKLAFFSSLTSWLLLGLCCCNTQAFSPSIFSKNGVVYFTLTILRACTKTECVLLLEDGGMTHQSLSRTLFGAPGYQNCRASCIPSIVEAGRSPSRWCCWWQKCNDRMGTPWIWI